MKTYNYIYLIKNNINQKIYIGKHSTDNLDDGYMGSGILIKKAIQKYGIENFTKDYLAFCDSEDTLNYLEKFYIKKYKAKEVGYNLTDGGEGLQNPNNEIRQKISASRKGKPRFLGRTHSSNTKQKISESHKGDKNPNFGKPRSEETKRKISAAKKGKHNYKGENSPFYGKHHTEETKQQISKTIKLNGKLKGENNPFYGKHHTEETKRKLREAWAKRKALFYYSTNPN